MLPPGAGDIGIDVDDRRGDREIAAIGKRQRRADGNRSPGCQGEPAEAETGQRIGIEIRRVDPFRRDRRRRRERVSQRAGGRR